MAHMVHSRSDAIQAQYSSLTSRVQEALAGFDVASLRRYPRPTADPLRDRLALKHGLTRDHVLPISRGGENSWEGLAKLSGREAATEGQA